MSVALRLSVCSLCLLLVPSSAGAALTAEHFNYGSLSMPLTSCSGGENWAGGWFGYVQLSPVYDPDAGLAYGAPCYENASWSGHEGNDPEHGGAAFQSYRPATRHFPAPLTGAVWVSALHRLGPNQSFRGFSIGDSPRSFYVGFTNDCEPYVRFLNGGLGEGAGGYSTTATHLVVAKVEFNYNADGHDRLSIWVNPGDTCHGETGLGAPDASVAGFDAVSAWSTLALDVGNGSCVDAIRVSHGTDATIDEVLYREPHDPVATTTWGCIKSMFD